MPFHTGTCQAVSDYIARETGRINGMIEMIGLVKHPIMRFMPQDGWPDFMGATLTKTVDQRSFPTTESAWSAVTVSDGSASGPSVADFDVIPKAYDQVTYTKYERNLRSEYINLEDLRTAARPGEQLGNYVRGLGQYVNYALAKRMEDQYITLCDRKIIAAASFPEGSTWPATAPTLALSLGILRDLYEDLYTDGAGEDGDAVDDQDRPVFTFVTDYATMENLTKNTSDIRQDIRWSDRVNWLLEANGALLSKASFAGINFVASTLPPRYNDNGAGGFTRIEPYGHTAATKGSKAVITAAYKNAKYQDSYFFIPKVTRMLVPSPTVKIPEADFPAQNYTGDMLWWNQLDATCNPFGETGFWYGKLRMAFEPVLTQYGVAIMHLRCGLADDAAVCPTGVGYGEDYFNV